MSDVTLSAIGAAARRTALQAAWTQWSAVTHTASQSDDQAATAVVDPEALLLLSLTLWDDERRLRDLCFAFAVQDAKLLSVHRAQALCEAFPEATQALLSEFASWAKHPSWFRLAKLAVSRETPAPREKSLGPLRLHNPPALYLRFRTAFGVGLKSDLLTCAVCRQERSATVAQLATFVAYSERNTRAAADDLVDAGLLVRDDYSPQQTYRAAPGDWAAFLSFGADDSPNVTRVPRWQPWSVLFAFLAHVADTARRSETHAWSDYVCSSRARDIVELHYPTLIRAEVAEWSGVMPGKGEPLAELDRLVAATRSIVVHGL